MHTVYLTLNYQFDSFITNTSDLKMLFSEINIFNGNPTLLKMLNTLVLLHVVL